MRRRLAEVQDQIADLKENLAGYYEGRNALRHEIMRTYAFCRMATVDGWPKLVVTKWTADGAERRFAMLPRLDKYNRTWAPVVNEMRALKLEAKALEHAIKAEEKAKIKGVKKS